MTLATLEEGDEPGRKCGNGCETIPAYRVQDPHGRHTYLCVIHIGDGVEHMVGLHRRIVVQRYNPATGEIG